MKKFLKRGDSRYIYQNELDKACFQHDMAHGDFKDLNRRTIANKVLHNKAFNIAKNPKYERCQRGLPWLAYNSFDKITSGAIVKNEIISIKELPEN